MADETIHMDTTTAVAAPQRKQQICAMKKWVLRSDLTLNNSSIFSDNSKVMQWDVHIDLDPNGYFREFENPNPSGSFYGEGAFTQIFVNVTGYYLFTLRATIFADLPVLQNGESSTNFWTVGGFTDRNGWSPQYAQYGPSSDLLGDGTYPTGTSTMICQLMSLYYAGDDAAASMSVSRSKIVAGGHDYYKDTYLTGVFMGVSDGITVDGSTATQSTLLKDPYYTAKNLGR